jgi:predicted helicase
MFLSFSLPRTYNAHDLAIELAKRTRYLEGAIESRLAKEYAGKTTDSYQNVYLYYEAFKKTLLKDLTKEEFADLYAQTITYGLFAARSRSKGDFNRKTAYDNIPRTIGILRDIFRYISLEDLPQEIEWAVDEIAAVLSVADIQKIMDKYYHEGKGKDPIIHFYETFLAKYDPKLREKRGVYYTPEPVVSYIVRSINIILKEYFGKNMGLAEDSVTVLDPAAGTLTFMAEAFKQAISEFIKPYGPGKKQGFIKEHLLKNFYAFELMMAPYAIGHLKISLILEELGYSMDSNERFKLFLTNTLDMDKLEYPELPGMASLAEESKEAGKVKKDQPILVIMGNPPYSGHSANTSDWIVDLLKEGDIEITGHKDEGYYKVDGKPLNEKNPKWLQDDYVKFIRFAEWKINRAGQGVLGFITNHSYLDNPTFRGMRRSLMKSFDEIYILDLHGNSLKKEKCPDGSKDENVFDIMQGVSIVLLIKKPGLEKKVLRAELFGRRLPKYDWLSGHDKTNTKWTELKPQSEFYFFTERNYDLEKHYNIFHKVTNIFPLNGVGMTTARDKFVINKNRDKLLNKVRLFKHSKDSDELLHRNFKINVKKGWSIRKAWNMLQSLSDSELNKLIIPVYYRPFDIRWIFYHDSLVWRTVKRVMHHFIEGENLGLIARRQMLPMHPCNYFFISDQIIADGIIRSDNKGGESLFPLYLYPDEEKNDLFGQYESGERKPNIDEKFYQSLTKTYGAKPTPEHILYYVYAVMYADTYREKYAEFLKTDFPHIPFTKDHALFLRLGELGKDLTELHLLTSKKLFPPISKFWGKEECKLGKTKKECRNYNPDEKRVYVNKEMQYFDGIEPDVWEYQIGGYQVLDKWLDSHKERKLNTDDVMTFCKIVTALSETIKVQEKIDELYPQVEETLIDI